MQIGLLPKSRTGKWSVGLSMAFLSIGIVLYIFAELFEFISSHVLITVLGTASIITQIIAFCAGVVAVIKNKERSALVFLTIVLGLAVLGFILGDISGLISD